jgi:hypothetical protein
MDGSVLTFDDLLDLIFELWKEMEVCFGPQGNER